MTPETPGAFRHAQRALRRRGALPRSAPPSRMASRSDTRDLLSRRRLLGALALAPAGPALAACRTPAPARPGQEAATARPRLPAGPVTLRLWHWDDFLIEPYTSYT